MKIAELFRVEGQVALVTGGAGGLGYACAEVLAENGAAVCIVDRDADKLGEAAERLSRRSNAVMAREADVTEPASMNRAVADVTERFGRLDIAFINAGIGGGPGFLDISAIPMGPSRTSTTSSGTGTSTPISARCSCRSGASSRPCGNSGAAASSSPPRLPR